MEIAYLCEFIFFGSLETGSSGGIFLSQKWELGMIVFHEQVIEAVCAGRCLGRVVCGQNGTKALDFFRKKFDQSHTRVFAYFVGYGNRNEADQDQWGTEKNQFLDWKFSNG